MLIKSINTHFLIVCAVTVHEQVVCTHPPPPPPPPPSPRIIIPFEARNLWYLRIVIISIPHGPLKHGIARSMLATKVQVRPMRLGTHHYNDVIMSAMESHITGVSIVCSAVCSGAGQRKHHSSVSLAFVREIHRWPVYSPKKRTSNAETASIWWHYYVRWGSDYPLHTSNWSCDAPFNRHSYNYIINW